MTVGTELEQDTFINWQLVGSKQLPALGINTFTINFIASSVFSFPIHFAAPAIFINVPSYQGEYPLVPSIKAPFVRHRNSDLTCNLRKVVVIIVDRAIGVQLITTNQGLCYCADPNLRP